MQIALATFIIIAFIWVVGYILESKINKIQEQIFKKQMIDFVKWVDKYYYQGEKYNQFYKVKSDLLAGNTLTAEYLYSIYLKEKC